jgi:ribonuclease HI
MDRVFDPLDFATGNPIYTDGSCKNPFTPNALSAGAAVTLVEGTPRHGTYHAVGLITSSSLQHNSFFGEVTGLVAALELTRSERAQGIDTVIHSDSLAAVTSINRLLLEQAPRWRSRWDGLWSHILTANQAWTHLQVHKVKAHQALTPDTPQHLVPHIVGNMIADQIANKTVDYYMPRALPAAAEIRAAVRQPLQAHIDRLLLVRQALPAVPRPAKFCVFAKRRADAPPDGPSHRLHWSGRGARCTECFKFFSHPQWLELGLFWGALRLRWRFRASPWQEA